MRIEHVSVAAYRIPTDAPESDGTYAWDATTLVVVRYFDGAAVPHEGAIRCDDTRPGLGLELKEQDAQCCRI